MSSSNHYYIASFAPLLTGQKFNGLGEFYLYESNNGQVRQLQHFTAGIRASNGESNIEYFDSTDKTIAVSIVDKLEIQFFLFKGYVWSLPKNYYDYNVK